MDKLDELRKAFQIAAQTASIEFVHAANEVTDQPGKMALSEAARFVGSVVFNVFLATQNSHKEMGFNDSMELAQFLLDFAGEEMTTAFEQCVTGAAVNLKAEDYVSTGQTLQ